MMREPWILTLLGFLFCIAGIVVFNRDVHEENRTLARSILLMILGVILISIGTAKWYFA